MKKKNVILAFIKYDLFDKERNIEYNKYIKNEKIFYFSYIYNCFILFLIKI